MKHGKGGDSIEAIKAVWMEGYREGRRIGAGTVPFVEIDPADIEAVYAEPCSHPETCPACGTNGKRKTR